MHVHDDVSPFSICFPMVLPLCLLAGRGPINQSPIHNRGPPLSTCHCKKPAALLVLPQVIAITAAWTDNTAVTSVVKQAIPAGTTSPMRVCAEVVQPAATTTAATLTFSTNPGVDDITATIAADKTVSVTGKIGFFSSKTLTPYVGTTAATAVTTGASLAVASLDAFVVCVELGTDAATALFASPALLPLTAEFTPDSGTATTFVTSTSAPLAVSWVCLLHYKPVSASTFPTLTHYLQKH